MIRLRGYRDATKDFPTVTATVKDGVITVSGELKSDDWKRLKMALGWVETQKGRCCIIKDFQITNLKLQLWHYRISIKN